MKGRSIVDLTGKQFGYLTVLGLDEKKSSGPVKYWTCRCECGKTTSVQGGHLKNGNVTSCGCHHHDKLINYNKSRVSFIKKGTKFGEWTVLDIDNELTKEKGKQYYICECSCGTIRSVKKDSLLYGYSISCGCIKSKGEKKVSQLLRELNIQFEQQKTFDGCFGKAPLRFDFYIPSLNMCIEYNGFQHYHVGCGWNDYNKLLSTKRHDKIKIDYCYNNNIKLLVIPYVLYKYLNHVTLLFLIANKCVAFNMQTHYNPVKLLIGCTTALLNIKSALNKYLRYLSNKDNSC